MLSIFQYDLSLSAFIKIYDMPLGMFGYVRRSLHIMSYPKNEVLYQGEFIVYCVSSNKNMYFSNKA